MLGLALFMATSTGGAEAGFSPKRVEVLPRVANINLVASAVSNTGEVLIAWTQPDSGNAVMKLRRISPDGSVSPVIDVTANTSIAGGAAMTYTADGRAVIVFQDRGISSNPAGLKGVWVFPDNTLGPIFTVRNGGVASDSGEIEIDATAGNGGALAAWHNFQSSPGPFRKVESRMINADNSVGPLLMPASGAGSTKVNVAADLAGGGLLAWREGSSIKAQHVTAASALDPVETPVATSSANAGLTTDHMNGFRVIYRTGTTPSALQYRPLTTNGAGGTEQTLFPAVTDFVAGFDQATNLATRTLVTWTTTSAASPKPRVSARFIGADGLPEGNTITTPDDGVSRSSSGVAMGSEYGSLIWDEAPDASEATLFGRILPEGAQPGEPVPLSDPTFTPVFGRVDMAENGVGAAIWGEYDGTDSNIVARQILPAPECFPAGATVVQGRPVSIPLTCTGFQLEGVTIVTQPAQGTATVEVGSRSILYAPRPGYAGPDTLTFAGTNPGGTGEARQVTISVGRDTVAPKISALRVTPRRLKKKASVRLGFSEPSRVRVKVQLKKRGRFRTVGTLQSKTLANKASLKLKRKLGKRRLRPGRYRVRAVATDAAGNRSKTRNAGFRVRR